jgi:hypothetical protein
MVAVGAGSAVASGSEVQHGREYAARGSNAAGGGGGGGILYNHGGKVLTSASPYVQPIFWGNKWSNSSFVGDKETGLATFYSGWTGSGYANTTTEYAGSNGQTSGGVSYLTAIVDTSAGPTSPPSTAQIVAEVAARVSTPKTMGYYPVYTDLKRGSAGYCAWHDQGIVHGVAVEVAFFFDLDGDAGCDPQDSSGNHSQGLAALANVSGHELSEAKTDPQLNAWYDRRGSENADKCAWHFHNLSTFSNNSPTVNSVWKIQGNWSNAAYNAASGYYNRGCIDGN